METALCALVARRSPALADRMWSTVTVGDRETIDGRAREQARRLCAQRPLRLSCLADSIHNGWKDRNIVGGLDYQRRMLLARLIASDMGIERMQLRRIPAYRVRTWLEEHPNWQTRINLADASYWRQIKRDQRRQRAASRLSPCEHATRDTTPIPPPPNGMPVQGTLF